MNFCIPLSRKRFFICNNCKNLTFHFFFFLYEFVSYSRSIDQTKPLGKVIPLPATSTYCTVCTQKKTKFNKKCIPKQRAYKTTRLCYYSMVWSKQGGLSFCSLHFLFCFTVHTVSKSPPPLVEKSCTGGVGEIVMAHYYYYYYYELPRERRGEDSSLCRPLSEDQRHR